MPNFTGGHYFLTALAPMHTAPCKREDGTITSPAHAVREVLASLPTAQHSRACIQNGTNSPFARNLRTHFARLAVIDDVAFNGRDPQDAIVSAIRDTDLTAPQAVDRLDRPYLLICLDFDAPDGTDATLDAYLAELWQAMPRELAAILVHCERWTGQTAADFAGYVRRCQVETTLPFNNYGIDPLPAGLTLQGLIAQGAAAGAVLALAVWFGLGGSTWLALLAFLLGLVGFAYWKVRSSGRASAPLAPDQDLRTVLKALHLQQGFTTFAATQQGAAPEALHAAFGGWLAAMRPGDLSGPTQPPGVLKS
jgi:hypothetical protein